MSGVCVLGGVILDLTFRAIHGSMRPGTSNPARTSLSSGGVGRNIADHLARWGVPVTLLAAVGDDALSASVLDATRAAGVDVERVRRIPDTVCGLYAALLDDDGELSMAASSMKAIPHVDANYVDRCEDTISGASYLVVGLVYALCHAGELENGVHLGMELARETVLRPGSAPPDIDRAFVAAALARLHTS